MTEATTFLDACRSRLRHAETLLAQIISQHPKRTIANTAQPANALAIDIDWAAAMASLYQSVHPDPDVRHAAELAEQEVSRFTTELSLNRAYYEAVLALPES